MSALKFWNNPLVVSAMRVKYRKSSPGITASIYLIALLGVGALLNYIDQQAPRGLPIPLSRAYLVAILGLQFLVSGAIGLFGVAGSMTAEVANRTLDFQRIVSLSPRQIMLGKMLGEPALGYFLALTTVPLAVLCWFFGAAPAGAVAMFYVNLATFTVMAASLGLMHTLVIPENSANKNRGSFAGAFIVFPILILQFLAANAATGWGAVDAPWTAAPLGLLTPAASIFKLAQGDPWGAVVPLWGIEIPSLVAAPIMQLAVAGWIMAAMARRLRSTLDPPLKRSRVYGAVAVVDLIAAGVCYTEFAGGLSLSDQVYRFGLVHLIACFAFMLASTPSKEAISSWLWRLRGKQPLVRDLLGGDRSPAVAMYFVQGVLGAAIFVLAAWMPARAAGGPNTGEAATILPPLVAVAAMALAGASLYQALGAVSGKIGRGMTLVLLALLAVTPPMVASGLIEAGYWPRGGGGPADLLMSISPPAYLVGNAGRWNDSSIPALPPILVYSAVFVTAAMILRRTLVVQGGRIERKLEGMGVRAPQSA